MIARGYRALKFDPFGNGNLELSREEFLQSIQLIEAVHAAIQGNAELFIEMHGRFAPHQAVQIAKAIEKFSPGWIEEPCRATDVAALRYVMDHTSVPIATGERLYSASAYNELFAGRLANMFICGNTLHDGRLAQCRRYHRHNGGNSLDDNSSKWEGA